MNAFTGKELTAFYVKVPDYHLPLAIDLLADIFNNSLFNLDDIDKEKSVVLQEISMVEDTPDEYIHDIFEKHFWKGIPWACPSSGRETPSMRSIAPRSCSSSKSVTGGTTW